MALSNAHKQKRLRLKQNAINKEKVLVKERQRKKESYIPYNEFSSEKLKVHREKIAIDLNNIYYGQKAWYWEIGSGVYYDHGGIFIFYLTPVTKVQVAFIHWYLRIYKCRKAICLFKCSYNLFIQFYVKDEFLILNSGKFENKLNDVEKK